MKRILLSFLGAVLLWMLVVSMLMVWQFIEIRSLVQDLYAKPQLIAESQSLDRLEAASSKQQLIALIASPFLSIPKLTEIDTFIDDSLILGMELHGWARETQLAIEKSGNDGLGTSDVELWFSRTNALVTRGFTWHGGAEASPLKKQFFDDEVDLLNNSGLLQGFLWWQLHAKELEKLAEFLISGERQIIVLLQNNMELRPTGGYLGSYGQIQLQEGKLVGWEVQDIGFPNGQLEGYVPEPPPLREYLFDGQTPGWRLRDANFHPDFPTAATQLKWFFEEGGVRPVDALIGINLGSLLPILAYMGPLEVPDVGLIDAWSFYQQAQAAAENDFFDGSRQKGYFLGAVARRMVFELEHSPKLWLGLLGILQDEMNKGEVQLTLFDAAVQEIPARLKLDGSLGGSGNTRSNELLMDYMMLNEANVGINKTNCCLDREIQHMIDFRDNLAYHTVQINYSNHNPAVPEPPIAWGGGYKAYVRLIVPQEALWQEVRIDEQEQDLESLWYEPMGHLQAIGVPLLVQGGMQGSITFEYQLYLTGNEADYHLLVQKQPGMTATPYTMTWTRDATSLETTVLLDRSHEFDWSML